MRGPRFVLGCAVFVACGLQRDYEAFLKAAANDSDVASSTGATGSEGSDTGTTGGAASGSTGPGDSGSTGETSGGLAGESSGSGSTGATGGPGSTGGTTGSHAVCGDGVVEGEEECDSPEAPCFECIRDRLVFVTSRTNLYGDWAAGSPIYWCNHLAAEAKLLTNNEPRFVPWASDSEASAAERIHHSRGRYVLRNGLVFARSWDDLVAGNIENPLNVDENSETVNSLVWTDTRPDGSAMPGTHCNDWTSQSFDDWAYYGDPGAVDGSWTLFMGDGDNPILCAGPGSLYCFESP